MPYFPYFYKLILSNADSAEKQRAVSKHYALKQPFLSSGVFFNRTPLNGYYFDSVF